MKRTRPLLALAAAIVLIAVIAVVWRGFAGATSHTNGVSTAATWRVSGADASLNRGDDAVPVNDNVLLTTDSGASFSTLTSPDAAKPTAHVYFRTPSLGWSATTLTNPSALTSTMTIRRTTDGGQAWSSTTLPQISVPGARAVSMTFLDARQGWLSVSLRTGNLSNPGVMFGTNDGGATWTQAALPFSGTLYEREPL
ncbi:MAG: WD40/YVTN/BNR-like repeat-containing protein [Ktedonobacterales bacterium]